MTFAPSPGALCRKRLLPTTICIPCAVRALASSCFQALCPASRALHRFPICIGWCRQGCVGLRCALVCKGAGRKVLQGLAGPRNNQAHGVQDWKCCPGLRCHWAHNTLGRESPPGAHHALRRHLGLHNYRVYGGRSVRTSIKCAVVARTTIDYTGSEIADGVEGGGEEDRERGGRKRREQEERERGDRLARRRVEA